MAFLDDAFHCLSQRRDRSVIKDNDDDQGARRDNQGDPKQGDHALTCRRCGKDRGAHYGNVRCYRDEDVQFLPPPVLLTDAVPDARFASMRKRVDKDLDLDLLDRLAAVEQDRDEWKRLQQQSSAQIVRLGEQVSEALDQADALKEATAALLALRAAVDEFVQRSQQIRDGSPNAFYAHVDAFCKSAGVTDQDGPRHE